MRYSVQSRDGIFVKGYGFSFFAKSMGINISKSISKNWIAKHTQIYLNHAKQSAVDAFKTASKKSNSKNSRSNC